MIKSQILEEAQPDGDGDFEGFFPEDEPVNDTQIVASSTAADPVIEVPAPSPDEIEDGEIQERQDSSLRDIELKLLVSQVVPEVVQELETTLRAICVPERVLQAEKSASDWRRMAEMAVRRPESFSKTIIGKEMSHPVHLPLKEFLLHPMASPIWRLQTRLSLNEVDINFKKWWKKIHTDDKYSPEAKLSRYLEMINLFLATGDHFWPTMATNPTYYSIQKVASELAAMAGWLKASALELRQVEDAFAAAANDVAHSSQRVSEVRFAMRHLWPAGFHPDNLHFDGDPYANASLYAREDDTQCLVSPQFKVFSFNVNEKWNEQAHFNKRQKLTTPTQYAKRKIETTSSYTAKIPFSTLGRT